MNLRILSFACMLAGIVSITSCKDEKSTESIPTETNIQTNETKGATAALNPAHGQPGHRCEIPVGAPLNQESATNSQQQQTVNPVSSNTSPVRVQGSTTALKNPPHGQPGHNCAVPVGADLPSQ